MEISPESQEGEDLSQGAKRHHSLESLAYRKRVMMDLPSNLQSISNIYADKVL